MKAENKRLNFIKVFLEEIHEKFPQTGFRCHFSMNSTYIIEVKPMLFYRKNEKFAELEYYFCLKFEAAFPGYEIMFISDNSALHLFNGKIWDTLFEIGAEKSILKPSPKQIALPSYDYDYSAV